MNEIMTRTCDGLAGTTVPNSAHGYGRRVAYYVACTLTGWGNKGKFMNENPTLFYYLVPVTTTASKYNDNCFIVQEWLFLSKYALK